MVKDKKIDCTNNIHLNIEEAFLIIDSFLPKQYTPEVLSKIPWSNQNQIRVVRSRKSGDLRIIRALKEVAEETKELLTQ